MLRPHRDQLLQVRFPVVRRLTRDRENKVEVEIANPASAQGVNCPINLPKIVPAAQRFEQTRLKTLHAH